MAVLNRVGFVVLGDEQVLGQCVLRRELASKLAALVLVIDAPDKAPVHHGCLWQFLSAAILEDRVEVLDSLLLALSVVTGGVQTFLSLVGRNLLLSNRSDDRLIRHDVQLLGRCLQLLYR